MTVSDNNLKLHLRKSPLELHCTINVGTFSALAVYSHVKAINSNSYYLNTADSDTGNVIAGSKYKQVNCNPYLPNP